VRRVAVINQALRNELKRNIQNRGIAQQVFKPADIKPGKQEIAKARFKHPTQKPS
jgi:hypothetical protein